ncbi:MAG: hypothetical protein NTV36_03410, partial [Candidatus Staskawiczbacteria bacterium]|nr:hypothetical protein [Candidatus Staskawiczbacteria bacterium]
MKHELNTTTDLKQQSLTYHYNDFTENHYRKILQHAIKNYKFRFFSNKLENSTFVLWRHDIDVSVHRALKIAKIEKEEGVKSTFFVMLQSVFYNFLEIGVLDKLIQILEMGHQVGLHFDFESKSINNQDTLDVLVIQEKQILET